MASNNSPQAFHFYSRFWTVEVDNILIDTLIDCLANGHSFQIEPPRALLNTILVSVNAASGARFMRSKLLLQFNKLRKRFNTFDYILNQEGVVWDEEQNYVFAKVAIWEAICQVHPMAEAYRVEGEPAWESLVQIFGDDDDASTENEEQIIVISSSDDDEIAVPVAVPVAVPEGNAVPIPPSGMSPHNPIIVGDDVSLSSKISKTENIFPDVNRNLFNKGTSEGVRLDEVTSARKFVESYMTPVDHKNPTHSGHSIKFDLNISPTESGAEASSTASCSPLKKPKVERD